MTKHQLRVFVGFDSREPITFAVAFHSILRHAIRPLQVTPLVQQALRETKIYTRDRRPNEATEFSLTRFLCPFLCGFEGWSLFVDSDILARTDVNDIMLYPMADPGKAVYVCQHEYTPRAVTKFDGHEQTTYPKKNWSSVMLFNNEKCMALMPEYVNKASGLELHRFQWTKEEMVGKLPLEWNHLVGEYPKNDSAKILHFTEGAPCFPDYADCDHADVWWDEFHAMLKPAQAVGEALRKAVLSA